MKRLLLILTSITSGVSGYLGYSMLTTQIRGLSDLAWPAAVLTLLAAFVGVWISLRTKRHLIIFGSSILVAIVLFYFAFQLTYGTPLKS